MFILGIVEEGEACDCGLPSKCIHKDPCCTPRSGGALIYDEGLASVELIKFNLHVNNKKCSLVEIPFLLK